MTHLIKNGLFWVAVVLILLSCVYIALLFRNVVNRKPFVFLRPTKTASRSIERSLHSLNCTKHVAFPSEHGGAPQDYRRKHDAYYIVLRHPYDRALSAFSFKKQGGEKNDEKDFDDVRFVQQYDTLENLVEQNPNLTTLPLLNYTTQYKHYFNHNKKMRPICYPELQKEWPKVLKELGCDSTQPLLVSNTSNSKKHKLGPKTKAFIDKHLAKDIEIYEKYCGHLKQN